MRSEELRLEIEALINKKCEGSYWDFKEKHIEDKEKLLHDIICMSNNLEDRDAYIIFGVEDRTKSIVGIDQGDIHDLKYFRDFLKDKKFFGGIRPEIGFESFNIEGKRVDVLVIKNSNHTPFFIVGDVGKVRSCHVYTRVNDTNTGMNRSADPNHVEYLWMKRFGLNRPKIEQLTLLLKKTRRLGGSQTTYSA